MNLLQIGHVVRARRTELGLAQEQLGHLTGVSRVTINQLENGALEDLGYSKLEKILGTLGIAMETIEKKPYKDALALAAKTASASYKDVLTASELKTILQTGDTPTQYQAHIMTLLDEAPTSLVLSAVKEAAAGKVSSKKILKHLAQWASKWQTNKAWA